MTSRWVRPYVLTGGRAGAWYPLYTHTLVSASRRDPDVPASPEAHLLLQHAAMGTASVAELSAHSGLPLGVVRVVLWEELIEPGYVTIAPQTTNPLDMDVLERVLDGLLKL